jgi:hypothetical protein
VKTVKQRRTVSRKQLAKKIEKKNELESFVYKVRAD